MSNKKPFIVSDDELFEDRKVTVLKVEDDSSWLRLMLGENRLAFRAPVSWNEEIFESFLDVLETGEALEADMTVDEDPDFKNIIQRALIEFKNVPKLKGLLVKLSPKSQAEWLADEELTHGEITALFEGVASTVQVQDEIESVKKK